MQSRRAGALRSLLFAPGNHARRREKAFECGADAVILDLEDAVPPAEKAEARIAVAAALAAPRACQAWVRVNGVDTPWCWGDLDTLVRAGLDGLVLPKVEDPVALRTLDWVITQLERERGLAPGGIEIVALVESARGLAAAPAIAAATPRLARLSYGIADYSLDVGLMPDDDEGELAWVRAALVQASRVAGLEPPVDSVVVQVRDGERFAASARRARRAGLRGKLCLHPDQVPLANAIFSPDPAEVERARSIVAAFEAAEAAGSAAISVGGEFVDYPVVARARGVLELAERIARTGTA
ncbi:MAG: CoA ester lyase [Steroidobacteraceae bacterium]|jgi:citrate lyase subunit beta/citryl-CoA lyase|nr:CoA ester lyase [Steroidobacteraceae bacterium]